jgi:glutamate 5-kinase
MSTKIVAANLATSAGVTTVITRASNPGNIAKITQYLQKIKTPPVTPPVNGISADATLISSVSSITMAEATAVDVPLHTRFLPSTEPIRDRSFWILHGLKAHGTIYIDSGAHRALVGKAGLLPAGVVDVEGTFAQQEAVRIVVVADNKRASVASSNGTLWDGSNNMDVGRAIVNYSSTQIARIKGRQSTEIELLLGYADSGYVAERESISLFRRESRPVTPLREHEGFVHGITEYESKS